MIEKLLCLTFLTFIFANHLKAQFTLQEAFPNLEYSSPVFLTHSGDNTNRIFILEQNGRIMVFPNSPAVTSDKTFLDITDRVSSGGEMGLLGLAFHPNYENNGYFYVNYTAENPLRTIISRFQITNNPDSADKNSELEILSFSQPYQNHNGGWIGFGPNDNYLYIATGDGGSGGDPENYAQRIDNLLGKILCIDINSGMPYSIPSTNPFFDSTNAQVKKEIFAWGLRNPWRCSFDPNTGWLWAGDVGQDDWEEIDIIQNGKNYGWRCYEGNHIYNFSGCNYPEYIPPVWEYNHVEGYSITGGYVYRGVYVPELNGKYIYGDFIEKKIYSLEYDGVNPPVNQFLLSSPGFITSFGVDEQNELYIVGFGPGKIYSFTPTITSGEKYNFLTDYILEQNYPNPFNPSTTISYFLPEDSEVSLTVYNSIGKEIVNLLIAIQSKGYYNTTWNAEKFSSGVYFIKMDAISLSSDKSFSNIIKTLFLK